MPPFFCQSEDLKKNRNPAEPFCRLRIIALLKAFKTEQSRQKAFNKEAPPALQKVREALLFMTPFKRRPLAAQHRRKQS